MTAHWKKWLKNKCHKYQKKYIRVSNKLKKNVLKEGKRKKSCRRKL